MISEIKETFEEIKARKKAELEGAIERGEIADPIFTPAFFISLAVSASISTASYFISRALTPKQRIQQGKLSGSLQLQNSEQGLMIPEVYGASPDVSLTAGSNPTYQNVANCSTGAGGAITKNAGGTAWNAGASHNVSVASGQDAFFEFTVGTGYATAGFTTTASPVSGNTDFKFGLQWNPDGSVTIKYNNTLLVGNVTTWITGDRFRVELRSGRFRAFKGSAEIRPQNFVPPTPTSPLYLGIAIQNVGAGISEAKVKIDNIGATPNAGRGGVKLPAIIIWTSGIRKNVSTTQQPTGGGKGGSRTATVENTTYDIDLGLMYSRGPVALLREFANADVLIDQVTTSLLPSGVYDPGTGADPNYDPEAPPDPSLNYLTSVTRVDNDIAFDGDNVGSGTIQGGGSLFTIYEGNAIQDPDPTIEADVDAKYGTGSTPAYRNHSLIIHKNFLLSRWGGIVPNMTAVWEHTTLKTWDTISASLTERVGLIAGDYDYTLLSGLTCRGLMIAGRLFSPAEIIDSEEIQTAAGFFVTEAEGKIIGYTEGSEPSITISDTEVGWLDSDAEPRDIVPEVESRIAQESSLARQVDVKFIDPDNQWEPNTQSAKRQITEGVGVQLLEVQLCLLADEARAVAQKKLYKDYVAGTAHKFTLPWTYMYLYPGYKIIINRAEGFTHVIRLTSTSGGVGILECEGIALEPEVYNQPAVGAFNGLPELNIQSPAMTVVTLLDIPLFRDGDASFNDGLLQYAVGTPRTGFNQSWQGFALYISRLNEWTPLITSDVPGIIGSVVSASSLSTDPDTIDHVGSIIVDLYGTTATLASVVEADIGLNLALAGDMVFNFATATQVGGFPNRWQLTALLNGQKTTVPEIPLVGSGDRFVLLNDAVKPVAMQESEINQLMSYRAVTSGQSLGDAATVTHVWTGVSLKPPAPSDLTAVRDVSGDWHISAIGNAREGEEPNFNARIRRPSDGVTMRDMPVALGITQAAVFADSFGAIQISKNSLSTTTTSDFVEMGARTAQEFTEPGAYLEFTLPALNQFPGGSVRLALFHSADTSWNTPSAWTVGVYTLFMSPKNVTTGEWGMYAWDVGGESSGELLLTNASIGLGPIKIRLVFVGSELRIYKNWTNSGATPIAISKVPPGVHFPMKAVFYLVSGGGAFDNNDAARVVNAVVGGVSNPGTIYSLSQQILDNGSGMSTIDVEMWQLGRVDGFSVRKVFP